MNKKNLGIIFGGMSVEHDVSVESGINVIKNISTEKYNIFPIYIDENGKWYKYNIGEDFNNLEIIENIFAYLSNLNVAFPVLHGLYGEDGTIQGLLELLKIPYVGCKVLSSSIGMDKVYSKIVFEKAGIKQGKYAYVKENNGQYKYIDESLNELEYSLEEICNIIIEKLQLPLFIKPANSGSSVGINKAKTAEQVKEYIEYASKFDKKILIEENINGRELECAILGNQEVKASCVGEILPAEEFYTFNAKYNNKKSQTIIPANLSEETNEKIKKLAIKAFKAIDGMGFARVDFFLNDENGEVYINEINTIPGFTEISMYPKMWNESGISYEDLIDELIELSLEK